MVGAGDDMVLPASVTPQAVTLRGKVKGGTTAGIVALEWAQNVEDAGQTQILSDVSYLTLDRVAI